MVKHVLNPQKVILELREEVLKKYNKVGKDKTLKNWLWKIFEKYTSKSTQYTAMYFACVPQILPCAKVHDQNHQYTPVYFACVP